MIETRFKDMEIGLIPEDWEVKPIKNICDVKRGVRVTRDMLSPEGEYPVFQNTNYPLGYFNKYNVEANTPYVIVGGSAGLIGVCNLNYWAADDCVYFSKKEGLDHVFLYYELLHRQFDIKKHVRSASVPRLDRKVIENLVISVPLIDEQKRIASALSDVDVLLRELGELIAKKKAIKMGMMQELLTVEAVPGKEGAFRPKRRLEGFEGDWKSYSFKELYKYASEGGTPDTSVSSYYQGGNIPFVKIEDTVNKYITSCKSFITEEGLAHSSAWMIPVNSVIFTNGATIGNVAINKIPVSTKQGILGIVPREIFDSEFLYYYLSSNLFLKEVHSRETVGTFAIITIGKMNEISVVFPSIKAEQTAIAEVLSDMDAEIAALEAKRAKYEQVKNGMMQELLTGRIRLV